MNIGDKVVKKSGKPFKSRNKVNTIKGFTVNPNSDKNALIFEEDDSIVDAYICIIYNDEDIEGVIYV